jgi:hypothetical protein
MALSAEKNPTTIQLEDMVCKTVRTYSASGLTVFGGHRDVNLEQPPENAVAVP